MKLSVLCLSGVFLSTTLFAADLFVAPNGNDNNTGLNSSSPLASLDKAREKARDYAGKEKVNIHFADGVYYLPKTVKFTAEDSGSEQFPIVYKGENEGKVILSGGSKLQLNWSLYKEGIYQAKTPADLKIDQLFIDGKNQRMARYPNYDPAKKAEPYQGYSADAFAKERAAKWSDPKGAYIHAMHVAGWGGYHYLITGKDDKGNVTYEGGWQNNRQMGMHKNHRMVENVFEELDAAGEWFHNAKTNMLYYMPPVGTELDSAKVEVVRLRHLIELNGSESKPVKHMTFQGFVVRHTARTFMDCKEPLLRSDWAIYRGGAFMLTGTENIQILDSEFDQVGGNAIFVNHYNRKVLVKGCHIHDTGASGVCFVGDPNAVRDPLFEYKEKNDLSKIDLTPGPKTNNYPADSAVEDCLIHGIGRTERQPAAVQISMAKGITVRDASIYDCARSGINISEGTWGGHLIERCDVFDTVLETHDHGSFNSWGRDRYWRSDHLKATQEAVDANPKLPFLDAMETTVIRDSRWRCDHGWDIDLDDGSTNYNIYNNLMLNKGLKLREGYRRYAWNNLAPFGALHPHVWFQGSGDKVYNNAFKHHHHYARMSVPYVQNGTTVNNNLFDSVDQRILATAAKTGWDKNSILDDPMYLNPAKGDFRIKEGSPLLKLGFKNFPMDQFGVKKASLKAIAKTPEIPKMHMSSKIAKAKFKLKKVWLGATVHDLKGEEFSAYGVSKEQGGVALHSVPNSSSAFASGLRSGDLIQGVNGKAVKNCTEFFRSINNKKVFKLKVIRNQQALEVSIEAAVQVVIEFAPSPKAFKNLTLPPPADIKLTSNVKVSSNSVGALNDGELKNDYGAVFGNGTGNGIYKMDLGSIRPITSISSWSYNKSSRRGAQKLTVYASSSLTDPGWDLRKFVPLGTIDTGVEDAEYTAASLSASTDEALGEFRWVVWVVAPVSPNGGGENTAFQELAVR